MDSVPVRARAAGVDAGIAGAVAEPREDRRVRFAAGSLEFGDGNLERLQAGVAGGDAL